MKKNIVIISIIVGLIIVGAVSAYFAINNIFSDNAKVNNVSYKFLKAARDARYEEAKNYLSNEGKNQYDEQKLKQLNVPELNFKAKPEIVVDQAKTVIGDNKANRFAELSLIKENKHWKISKINMYEISLPKPKSK